MKKWIYQVREFKIMNKVLCVGVSQGNPPESEPDKGFWGFSGTAQEILSAGGGIGWSLTGIYYSTPISGVLVLEKEIG